MGAILYIVCVGFALIEAYNLGRLTGWDNGMQQAGKMYRKERLLVRSGSSQSPVQWALKVLLNRSPAMANERSDSNEGPWVRYEDHIARVEELEGQCSINMDMIKDSSDLIQMLDDMECTCTGEGVTADNPFRLCPLCAVKIPLAGRLDAAVWEHDRNP